MASAVGADVVDLSKSALKRRLKKQHIDESWRKKKQQKKERKLEERAERAKRAAMFPDSEEGQAAAAVAAKQAERAALSPAERERRRQVRAAKVAERRARYLQLCDEACGVAFDLGFGDLMDEKEEKSLVQQVMFAYGSAKRADHPCTMHLVDLAGDTEKGLQNIAGFGTWLGVREHPAPIEESFPLEQLVYLTADSPNTVQTLDASKVYVIGGIVDRNRHPLLTLKKAERLGIATAKLPLAEHVTMGGSTPVLTVNHVFEIILHWNAHRSWAGALESVLPKRKEVKRSAEGGGGAEETTQDAGGGAAGESSGAADKPWCAIS
jgi:tRNA (guanine9-N1)-methyltransferase